MPPSVRHHLIRLDMKRKYCLIRREGDLTIESFVYVVWVGSSLHESTRLALVEEFCKDCGWYFKQWCPDVDRMLEHRARYSRVDGTRCAPAYQMIAIGIEKCYQTIVDDSWRALEASRVMTPQETFMRFRHDPSFLRRFNRQKRSTTCPPYRSKYLSLGMNNAFYGLAGPIAFIVALMVLDALVSNIISTITF